MNKKDLLANILSKLGLLPLARIINSSLSDNLTILAYHRIYDMGDENFFPFDPELISATQSDFKIQMTYVKNHYNPITFNDLINHINNGENLPKKPIIITFDDGHKDNYTNAYPILKELNMPAAIFISTEYIDSNNIFWFDWVAHLVYKTKSKNISLNNGGYIALLHNSIDSRRKVTEELLKYLMTLINVSRKDCLIEMAEQLNVKILENDKEKSSALSWSQVIEMSKNGIEFGSHTVSHPILSKLDDSELKFELKNSKKEIELHINKQVDTIAYPVGGNSEFNQKVVNSCKDFGYVLGVSYISGVEPLPIKNVFSLKRLHVERYTNISRFKAMLALPLIFS